MGHQPFIDLPYSPSPATGLSSNGTGSAILLLREMTHRVNNELASLIALIQRAARDLPDTKARTVLENMTECLYGQADVHRALATPECDGQVDASAHLGRLCDAISRSRLAQRGITLTLNADKQLASSTQCWMLGMIVSELITNAARHAFAKGGGDIRIDLVSSDGQMQCGVADNGSHSAQPQGSRRRSGLAIIEGLAAAMGGNVDQRLTPRGARTLIRFPAYADRSPISTAVHSARMNNAFERRPTKTAAAAE